MHIDEELLIQYLDGEASAEDAFIVAKAMRDDQAVHKRYRDLKRSDIEYALALKKAFSSQDASASTYSQAIREENRSEGDSISLTRKLLSKMSMSNFTVQWTLSVPAVAAMVAVSFFAGTASISRDAPSAWALSTDIGKVLESNAGGRTVQTSAGQAEVLLTFPRKGGGYCREVRVRAENMTRTILACRDSERWETVAIAFDHNSNHREALWKQASSANHATIEATIDALISGDVLDKEDEQSVMRAGWRG